MIEPFVFLIVGFFSTWFIGAVGRVLSTLFVDEQISPIVGFSVAIGFVLARASQGAQTSADLQQASLNIGMLGGLGLLWFLYFKRQKARS